ncbi:MAG: fluoride efflux transporter CrcB [Hyphomicrobiaceae bacterium]|nr:fluoride efflux transporter CrcB [Hyphomicrobiaceae bacterium]
MQLFLLATIGGGIGAGARYLIQSEMVRRLGSGFPWWTLAINVVGCLAMGIIADLIARRFGQSPEARALLMTGVLGGFTTFSAFALDFAQLMDRRDMAAAMGYVAGSVILTIAALYLGIAISRTIAP